MPEKSPELKSPLEYIPAGFSVPIIDLLHSSAYLGMLVPVALGTLDGVVALPGTVDDGTVVLCGTVAGWVLLPGMDVRGTLLLLGGVPCGVLGVVVGSAGTVVVLRGTVLCGTVDGWTVLLGTVVDDGCVTVFPGVDAPGNVPGCTVLPGTVFGCMVLPG